MLQFDAFANPDPHVRRQFPFVVCLQAQMVDEPPTQVIAPLVKRSELPGGVSRIAPLVTLDDEEYIAIVPRLTSVPSRVLKTRIANLARHRDPLLAAVDLVFYGF